MWTYDILIYSNQKTSSNPRSLSGPPDRRTGKPSPSPFRRAEPEPEDSVPAEPKASGQWLVSWNQSVLRHEVSWSENSKWERKWHETNGWNKWYTCYSRPKTCRDLWDSSKIHMVLEKRSESAQALKAWLISGLLSVSHSVDLQADCTVTVNPSDGEVQLENASCVLDCEKNPAKCHC